MLNSISVDTEEYYHATNIEAIVPRSRWDKMPSRVERSIDRTLELFSLSNVKATFFVLGIVAEKHPDMVKKIAYAGHEIASHGKEHRLVYNQTAEDFFADISYSKSLLEDIVGQKVLGYRAPNFSVTSRCPWAYEKLSEAGYLYDSSVYPIAHPRYTNVSKPRHPFIQETNNGKIFVLPLAVSSLNIFGKELRLPVAGGAYWRLFPLPYHLWGLRRIRDKDRLPFNCYFHPWEIDAEQPRFDDLSLLTKIRHYGGITRLPQRITTILRNFKFGTLKDAGRDFFGEQFKLSE